MKKSTLLSKLKFVIDKQIGLELYFLYRPKSQDNIEILRANLEGTVTQTKLEQDFITKIKSQIFNQDNEGKEIPTGIDWQLKHINEIDELKNVYYHFPNKESEDDSYHIPVEFEEMKTLQDKKYEDFSLFDFSKHLLDDVFAFLIRLQIDNEQVILYKNKYPFDILSRSTVLKLLSHEVGHRTKFELEDAPLLQISDKFDFIFIDDSYIILNVRLLESKFGFNERYLTKGAESLNFIKSKNILVDTKVLDDLVTKVSFAKKLMKVSADNEVLKTPIAEMKSFLDEFKTKDGKYSLAKRIKYIPKQNKFEVKTKVAADDFVRLLNDQYLISLLTKKPYIAEVQKDFENVDDKKKETK
ncbi:Kiwa anti-phage protein KwaB-like domain-containing protein [Plebeiibacterium sediminum]|uniref:DUF4868 domain-containing protein n=1 Tax=Plebeiibacterium sediminum TaxID=2992112 RepID=A0AAE3SGN6_9BACT|nr:Kiwa anti-phage protein KwaB-like domain-containing protein [Plebeiobacterium sediminum]MCW3788297.1 DUF4868 domain-containing protein [Plebeiobacterium sediminum]